MNILDERFQELCERYLFKGLTDYEGVKIIEYSSIERMTGTIVTFWTFELGGKLIKKVPAELGKEIIKKIQGATMNEEKKR